jgi:predicted ATPase/DNA-binding CsgD family transcriptional regulator
MICLLTSISHFRWVILAGGSNPCWYWYAYRRSQGKLRTAYLGKSEELTLQRLNTTAEALGQAEDLPESETHRSRGVVGASALPVQQASFIAFPTTRAQASQLREPEPAPTYPLPVQLTPLIGREHEAASAAALLRRPEVRLLTMCGAAGIGKTRLALQVATDLLEDFADGIAFVSLAPIRDPTLVLATIAHTLGLHAPGNEPGDPLCAFLWNKRLLLVLDNFEHVMAAASHLVDLLAASPHLKLLVTSREVLHLRVEQQFAVPPLALPDLTHLPDSDSIAQYPAVKLFLQRAQAVQHDFQITPTNAPLLAEICTRLDGLPLALELAAARARLLSPPALLARLDRRFEVLSGGGHDLPERQRTLRATLEWSYDLLSGRERRLFRRLSAFVGGCTLSAAEALCRALDPAEIHVFEAITSLLDKSLVQRREEEGSEPRLLLLETVREYAWEQFSADEEVEAVRQAHAAYYLTLAEEAEPHLYGAEQDRWQKLLEREQGNLRAALQWLVEGQTTEKKEMALRVASALARFWEVQHRLQEGRTFLERALVGSEEAVAPSVRARALETVVFVALNQGETGRAEALGEQVLALYRQLGDKQGMAAALLRLGVIARTRGDFATARPSFEEALSLYRAMEHPGNTAWTPFHPGNTAWALFHLGLLEERQGTYAQARARFEESLGLFRQEGDKKGMVNALYWLAWMVLNQGEAKTAAALLEEGCQQAREIGYQVGLADCLRALCEVALSQDDPATARARAEESLGVLREIGANDDQIASSLIRLGRAEARQGNIAAARACYEESLARALKGNFKEEIASGLEGLASVGVAQGARILAVQLWAAAATVRDAGGVPIPPLERADYEREVSAARVHLGEKAFASAWEEGRAMTPEQALASQEGAPAPKQSTPVLMTPPPAYPDGLTAREVEVLQLVTHGLTDAQVADQLVLSPRTVQGHLRSIYNKIKVSSRAAATRYAVEHKLV